MSKPLRSVPGRKLCQEQDKLWLKRKNRLKNYMFLLSIRYCFDTVDTPVLASVERREVFANSRKVYVNSMKIMWILGFLRKLTKVFANARKSTQTTGGLRKLKEVYVNYRKSTQKSRKSTLTPINLNVNSRKSMQTSEGLLWYPEFYENSQIVRHGF